MRRLMVLVVFLIVSAWGYSYFNLKVLEEEVFGRIFYVNVFLFALMTECAARGFLFDFLLNKRKMSFWVSTLIVSLFYLMMVYGNNRPYTFIDRSFELLMFDCLSKVVFSVLLCGSWRDKRSILFTVSLSFLYYSTIILVRGF